MAVTRFHSLLKAKLQEVISDATEAISCGLPSDYSSYKESVGYIRGLNDALRVCEDIERDLDK